MAALVVRDLAVRVGDKLVLQDVDLELAPARIHALMGPNGSGKSTLALALAGHPAYAVVRGQALLEGQDLLPLPPEARARAGLLVAFQNPPEVEGVKLREFLRLACAERGQGFCEFQKAFPLALARLRLQDFRDRELNVGFSGGEKKRAELLQLYLLRPKVALLDEPDSGVDVDALKLIAEVIREMAEAGTAVLLITHNPRLLTYLPPAQVFVLLDGRIAECGGPELACKIGEEGFEVVRR
ncbi:MAG: Fe-S cluster assembly ATPase SufC [Candidatus Bipolaricaulota bacterium]|nr:Fe-S cluster assembly ATPase SufC [Candidatus Bipolaricaulota bacterium]MDW8152427.1 Fe-S cluster assembly ATPase SufC [Candidatus Bipolaricaulota bacterium]